MKIILQAVLEIAANMHSQFCPPKLPVKSFSFSQKNWASIYSCIFVLDKSCCLFMHYTLLPSGDRCVIKLKYDMIQDSYIFLKNIRILYHIIFQLERLKSLKILHPFTVYVIPEYLGMCKITALILSRAGSGQSPTRFF